MHARRKKGKNLGEADGGHTSSAQGEAVRKKQTGLWAHPRRGYDLVEAAPEREREKKRYSAAFLEELIRNSAVNRARRVRRYNKNRPNFLFSRKRRRLQNFTRTFQDLLKKKGEWVGSRAETDRCRREDMMHAAVPRL